MVDVPYAAQHHLPPDDAISAMLSAPLNLDLDHELNGDVLDDLGVDQMDRVDRKDTLSLKSTKKKKTKKRAKGRRRRKEANHSESTVSAYVSMREGVDVEASVKGGAGNGYRMVLDEPVNKSMLSCHQCKNKKTLDRIIVCGHVYRINNTVKTCTKKYCKSCLLRFYLEAPPTDNKEPSWSSWKCPCCRYICCCAWCRKKKAKRLESVSNAIRAEAHRLTPAISLARKLVSESRVNQAPTAKTTKRTMQRSRARAGEDADLPPAL